MQIQRILTPGWWGLNWVSSVPFVIRSDEEPALERSAFQMFDGGNSTFINSFDKTHTSSNTVSLETRHLRSVSWYGLFDIDCACTPVETLISRFRGIFQVTCMMLLRVFKSCCVPYGACWCLLAQNRWNLRMRIC